jgi:hypothetical protein
MMKRAAELDRTDMLTGSLVDKAADIAKPYIDESKKMMDDTKKTIESVNTVVNEKTEQAKQAAQTAQEAYDKAQEAKNKLDTLPISERENKKIRYELSNYFSTGRQKEKSTKAK